MFHFAANPFLNAGGDTGESKENKGSKRSGAPSGNGSIRALTASVWRRAAVFVLCSDKTAKRFFGKPGISSVPFSAVGARGRYRPFGAALPLLCLQAAAHGGNRLHRFRLGGEE